MRNLIAIILFLSFIIPQATMAEQKRYIEYTIKKGDTLWDISGLKLKDPFFWPKIWKENPGIRNPDLIYPGQKLRIPLELMQKQVVLPPSRPSPVPARTRPEKKVIEGREALVVKPELIVSSGYIADRIEPVGFIKATPTGRTMVGTMDDVYLQLKDEDQAKRFYVIKSLGKVVHPVTKKPLGDIVEITGVVEITGKEAGYTKARVVKSFSEIEVGSPLVQYYDIEPFPLARGTGKGIHGTIVAARNLRLLNGRYDVVYIDRGLTDGVKVGTTFTVLSSEKPRRPIGEIQVISARQNTAVALVTRSEKEIVRGDTF